MRKVGITSGLFCCMNEGDEMANEQNLRPSEYKLTHEEQKKGGLASVKARREKKQMKEALQILLSMPLEGKKAAEIENIAAFKGLKGKNITVQDAVLVAQIQKALKGDRGSAEFIRDTVGEKPKDNTNISFDLPVFYEGEDDLAE